ncbi:hypothetical protein GCM10010112_71830 [Actinoplanes lobatus]|uniref:Uncharacterized protein n=1 Tax=Actinoplanes lobatus TaxID=113568 RepID=A0A7W7MJY5_9ACTN|nr:hypothetical protein [Actinoplanes lobatus]MBB4752836.1 hypothetical protein [Actinoplanes lobatus]GGN88388.1 hypothetical protein GCM10010112_71830 [Actinoplanes lobatus]GIE39446.1 hypothetical protein Alo02nite_23440 [Actinoplanes lobatus]
MTTDHLEVRFADLRADTLPTVQPPGTAAVRQTVRRRRTSRAVLSAAAAVLVIAGGITVATGNRSAAPPTATTPSTEPTPTPAFQQADIARQALIDGQHGTPVIDVAEQVFNNYRLDHGNYPGELILRAACAGTGEFMLYVDSQKNRKTNWKRIVELQVPCSAEPVAVSVPFTMTEGAAHHRFQMSEAPDFTDGQAGFAYQVTSKTGEPITGDREPADEFDPDRRLNLAGRQVVFEGIARSPGNIDPQDTPPSVPAGEYVLLTKCTGKPAMARLTVSQNRKYLVTADSPCTEPAGKQVETPVSWTGDPADLHIGFVTEEGLLHYALVRK